MPKQATLPCLSLALLILLWLGSLLGGGALAESSQPIPARPSGAVMVPEHFLRPWDPVTIFFDQPVGPAQGGIETRPQQHVQLSPEHPGVYQWLNRQTLQFRPVDPWPALSEFHWQIGERSLHLHTLMSAAISSTPAHGADNLAALDSVVLAFPSVLDSDALRRMLDISVYPLPGIDGTPLRVLSEDDFTLQALERAEREQPARYRLRLHEALGEGMRMRIRLRLSLDQRSEQALQEISFQTRRPFQAVSFGCASHVRALTRQGSNYPADEALLCRPENRTLEVQFSEEPAAVDVVQARNLIRFEPAVDQLEYRIAGQRLRISGDFQPDTLYRMLLAPSGLRDIHARPLTMEGSSSLYFSFPAPANFLAINHNQGRVMMERHGPRMLPLRGRGDGQVDLRIQRVDADDLRYWPWADNPVSVRDDARPPGPGEEPVPRSQLRMSPQALAEQLHALGSPSISELMDLPLAGTRSVARFGLDLNPLLERLGGPQRPGTYLLGLRRLGSDDQRQWLRLQVTDLSLTVVEEERQMRFFVTSLSSGASLANARVRIDSQVRIDSSRPQDSGALLHRLFEGVTDRDGSLVWRPQPDIRERVPERIWVSLGDDHMVIDVQADAPPRFFRNNFSQQGNWLGWTASQQQMHQREEAAAWHCHLFTERPVYRPEEPIHIAGYVRNIHRGRIRIEKTHIGLVIHGPDGSEWRHSSELRADGSFYYKFDEHTEASGDYRITLSHGDRQRDSECRSITVEKTAYRIPRFKVSLRGPQRTSMDQPFQVELDAEYYAGGMVQQRPLRWRVTQFPYHWAPRGREGFLFSSDSRYGGSAAFEARPALSSEDLTDERGAASLSVDPTQEPTAQPRRYVFEATVTGDDDQTVTDTLDVLALPPFVLGLKAPRYLEHADTLNASVIMLGPDEKLIAGEPMQVRLIRRRWAAMLQASDFTDGRPSYSTEVIDELIAERSLVSSEQALDFALPLDDTGVYLLEVSARDALGRTQSVELDLFNSAEARATWPKPPAETFSVSSERENYAPGETARLVLQSPLAEARALAIVELPDGSHGYHWLDVSKGRAEFELPLRREYMPSLPVHFLLKRGRLPQSGTQASNGMDLGKPVMMAATTVVEVSTAAHVVNIELEHATQARPRDELDMQIRLSDENGRPLSGNVTLWLVDQAVLALGTEQPLSPLPDFIRRRDAKAQIRDTRNRPVGWLPFLTEPGGDSARAGAGAFEILDGLSIRDTFDSVPFFEHGIEVGANGRATVRIPLPDDLTNFMVRAKASSGSERFGHQTGRIAVRLPVLVQPALPRFVRYGDRFTLSGTTRVIDGGSGPGRAALRVSGLQLDGPAEQALDWPESGTAVRLDWPVSVPMPDSWPEPSQLPLASITLGVERSADAIGDAFASQLSIHPDRDPVRRSEHLRVAPGETLLIPGSEQPVRDNSLQRSLLLSAQPALLEMAAGLNTLLSYSQAGTEPRISRARALLAAQELLALLYPDTASNIVERQVQATLAYVQEATLADGSVGFWPGASRGHIGTTAWALQFLVEAEAAGKQVDPALKQRLHDALKRALRGDYGYYHSAYLERTMALIALAANGDLDSGYAAELARRSQFLQTETIARVARALSTETDRSEAMLQRLAGTLWGGLVFRLQDGNEVYAGLRESRSELSPLILPSETRSIAQVLRAMHGIGGSRHREQQLVDVLVQLGRGNGWGSSNANSEAIMALVEALSGGDPDTASLALELAWNGQQQRLATSSGEPLHRLQVATSEAIEVSHHSGGQAGILHQLRYVPAEPGSQTAAEARGFVVERSLVRIDGEQEQREPLSQPGSELRYRVGEVIEDRLSVVNPELRHHVAIILPLAAGMEVLNPSLDTAPPEARVSQALSLTPDYVAYEDHQTAWYYETLPAGTYHFALRTRAQIPGHWTQPAARAELMYQDGVSGQAYGAAVHIERAE